MTVFLLYILFALMILLFIFFYLLNDKFYNYKKFINYIPIITAISTFVLAIGIIFQIISYKISEKQDIVQSFSAFSKDYIDSIVAIFLEHPEMNYYYLELFHGEVNKNNKRNIVLEYQINTRIIVKTIEQISIINAYNDINEIEPLKYAATEGLYEPDDATVFPETDVFPATVFPATPELVKSMTYKYVSLPHVM